MFVRKHKEGHTSKQFLTEKLLQILLDLRHTHLVSGVDHVDKSVGLVVVIAPVRADFPLTTDIPNVELEAILLLHT